MEDLGTITQTYRHMCMRLAKAVALATRSRLRGTVLMVSLPSVGLPG